MLYVYQLNDVYLIVSYCMCIVCVSDWKIFAPLTSSCATT